MAGRVLFFLNDAGFEAAYQAATMGITAVAMGDEVCFVFAFDALRQFARQSYGYPRSDREIAEYARAEGIGAVPPQKMLEDARLLGARFIACDTTVRICGLNPEDLSGRVEVMGLPSIWRLTDGARVVTL